jgi:hypothetical protein
MASHFSVYSILKSSLENINFSPFLYYEETLDEGDIFEVTETIYKHMMVSALDSVNARFIIKRYNINFL